MTAGVDLAAEAKGTALAVIEWMPGRAELRQLRLGVDDAVIVEEASHVDKLGIDCALGWPDEFVEFVSAHSAGSALAPMPMAEWTGAARSRTARPTGRFAR